VILLNGQVMVNSLGLHRTGVSTIMSDNLNSTRCHKGTIAIIVVCIIVFGGLMGIRSSFEQHWVQTGIAGCAGAFMGVALYQGKKCWPRNK
jgi:hypothetical protein